MPSTNNVEQRQLEQQQPSVSQRSVGPSTCTQLISSSRWRWHHQQQHCQQQLIQMLLLVLAAVALCPAPAAAWRDTSLDLGTGVYNPSLVLYQGSAWAVARSTQLKWDTKGLKWIVNRAHLCQINPTDWSTTSCHAFDPWRGRYGVQCRWGSDSWQVPWEAWGVDDTKLFVWPGHGLWAITGRRPERDGASKYCPQVIWQQWLVQLADEGAAPDPSHFNYPVHDDTSIPDVTWAAGGQQQPDKAGSSSSTTQRRLLRTLSLHDSMQQPAVDASTHDLTVEPASAVQQAAHRHLLGPAADDTADTADAELDYVGAIGSEELQQQQPQQQPFGKRRRRTGRRRKRRHRRPAKGSAAQPAGSSTAALQPPTQQLSSLQSSTSNDWSVLRGAQPVPLRLADAAAVYGSGYAITEKNWMPFVYQGQLLVSYTLAPKHVVYQLQPSGLAERRFETDTSAVFAPLGAAAAGKMHGGPAMVRIDASLLQTVPGGATASYYLGVAHYWEPAGGDSSSSGRVYKHYLIKVEAQPPFKVLKVSKELPLKHNDHYKQVAFVSGLHLAMLPEGAATAATTTSSSSSNGVSSVPSVPSTPAVAFDPQQLADEGPSSEAAAPAAAEAAVRRSLRSVASPEQQHLSGSAAGSARRLLQQAPTRTAAAVASTDSTGSLRDDADADEFTWLVDKRPADVNIFSWAVTPDTRPQQQQSSSTTATPTAAAAAEAVKSTKMISTEPGSGLTWDTAGPFVNVSDTEGAPPPPRSRRSAASPSPEPIALLPEDPPLQVLSLSTAPASPAATAGGSSTSSGASLSSASGLLPHVLLSYGSGDWGSRVLALTLQEVEELFGV